MKLELIKAAVDKLELVDIYLNDSRLERDNTFFVGGCDVELVQQSRRSIRAEWLEDDLGTEKEQDKQYLRALITLSLRFLRAGTEEKNQPKVLAEMEATFCALYLCKEPLEEEQAAEFLRFNAVHNVWPFWRERAFRMAAEARLPTPRIPLLRPKDGNNLKPEI